MSGEMQSPAEPLKRGASRRAAVALAAIVLPVFLFFGVLETAARVLEAWNPPMRVDLGQGFDESNRLFVPSTADHARMVTNPDRLVSFRRESFARVKPPRTLRIFVLGGSSVNYAKYFFMDMGDKLADPLRSRFDDVEVVDCGGLAYGSHRLVLVAREVLQYSPDFLLVYSGHNEFEEVQQMHLAGIPAANAQRFLSHSALYRLMRDWRARRQIARLESDRQARSLANTIPDTSKAWAYKFTPEEISGRMDAYRDNLATIVNLCRARGVPVIVGTVPSNLVKPDLPGPDGERYEREVVPLYCAGEWEKGAALGREILRNASPRHQSSDLENAVIRTLCKDMDVPMADVETAFIAHEPHHVPGESLFVDGCHPTWDGYFILAWTFAQEVLKVFDPGHSPEPIVLPRPTQLPCLAEQRKP